MAVSVSEFEYLKTLLYKQAGLVLDPGKEYLVEARLMPLARTEGYATFNVMIDTMKKTPVGEIHKKVVEAMTTNETSFYRDLHPFESLKNLILPGLISRRAKERRLNFWCGAASTGQEPYSISMMLREHFPAVLSWDFKFLATDLNTEVLDRARLGRYRQMEVNRGLPAQLLVKYFKERATLWEIHEDIRKMVDYREMNLAETWLPMPKLDVVFLRNVMIYFDIEMKKTILKKIRSMLAPDGYLFLGGAETTVNLDDGFEPVVYGRSTCYRLIGAKNLD